MPPPTPPPNRLSVSAPGHPLSARHSVQAARRLPRIPDPASQSTDNNQRTNTHNRINEAINSLCATRHAISELEAHHRGVIEAKDAEMATLQQRFTGLNTLHRSTKARLDDKIEDQGKMHTQMKTLKRELAAEKAKKGVADDDMEKRLVEAREQNCMLTAKVLGLENELADERATRRENEDAKRELEVMKTKLADMVSGEKVKVEVVE
ncbi:hypothetical protein BKA58DRAFT_401545 [Alternaria rosae]|uniref:uncharacterized protein n=1 Tax=Alternaria rosae TaxID=1187941 RepID=UPI001E8D74E0|nr:uncharacterized protein BKA58DRAFT_401545 [Alternaria rosae]KAH6869949.1 hypothetical protein BKA58DRAFT_401545 [Alternaria rosae]